MKEHSHEIEISVVGIDLGKNAFHVHGVDVSGHVVLKKQVTRKGLVHLMSQLPKLSKRRVYSTRAYAYG